MTANAGRSRGLYASLGAVTMTAGIATRKFPERFPGIVAEYAGDVLWAMLVFWIIAAVWRTGPTIRVATAAMMIALAVEISQLYRAEWVNAIRASRAGALVLGSGFLWSDLVCYAAGVALAAGFDYLRTRGASFP